jgi:hypothetical protein
MNMSIQEPDYTLTIIEEGGGFVVCEGGKSISKPFDGSPSSRAVAPLSSEVVPAHMLRLRQRHKQT